MCVVFRISASEVAHLLPQTPNQLNLTSYTCILAEGSTGWKIFSFILFYYVCRLYHCACVYNIQKPDDIGLAQSFHSRKLWKPTYKFKKNFFYIFCILSLHKPSWISKPYLLWSRVWLKYTYLSIQISKKM